MSATRRAVQDLLECEVFELARGLRKDLPREWGFALVLFTYEPGATAYASSGNRKDVARELREIADRLSEGTDDVPLPGEGSR